MLVAVPGQCIRQSNSFLNPSHGDVQATVFGLGTDKTGAPIVLHTAAVLTQAACYGLPTIFEIQRKLLVQWPHYVLCANGFFNKCFAVPAVLLGLLTAGTQLSANEAESTAKVNLLPSVLPLAQIGKLTLVTRAKKRPQDCCCCIVQTVH